MSEVPGEMVERVMRALVEVIAQRIPNDRSALDATKQAYAMARAAIAALREPSEAMIEACCRYGDDPRARWMAMIDAALGDRR